MKELLNKIYDSRLVVALLLTDDYHELKNIDGINSKIFGSETINLVLDNIISLYGKQGYPIINDKQKNSLLDLIDDIRFNYSFQSDSVRKKIITKVNNSINAININFATQDKMNDRELSNLYVQNLARVYEFFIVHYYLADDVTLNEEGLPMFNSAPELYVLALDYLTDSHPELTYYPDFLSKTLLVVASCINDLDSKCKLNANNKIDKSNLKVLKKFYKDLKKQNGE